jgi:hypothetical protein
LAGRHRPGRQSQAAGHGYHGQPPADEPEPGPPPEYGPFDAESAPADGVSRLDLGSVRVPVPEEAQLQVEVDQAGPVRAVHVLTATGQYTITAYAAPRSGQLWSQVRRELITELETQGARVRDVDGDWGREVVAMHSDLALHFIGVNGPRWLLRGVAAGPPERAAELAQRLRAMLRQTVVVRGDEPMPVRAPLPLTLPEPMAEQLKHLASGQQPPKAP